MANEVKKDSLYWKSCYWLTPMVWLPVVRGAALNLQAGIDALASQIPSFVWGKKKKSLNLLKVDPWRSNNQWEISNTVTWDLADKYWKYNHSVIESVTVISYS